MDNYIRTYRGHTYRVVSVLISGEVQYRIQEPVKLFGRILWWTDLSVMSWGDDYLRSSSSISFWLTDRSIDGLENIYHRMLDREVAAEPHRKAREAYGLKIHAKEDTC